MSRHHLYLATALALAAGTADAANINVLYFGNHDSTMNTLAAGAHTYDPASNGSNTWNLTQWNPSDPTPTLSNFDVLVIGTNLSGGLGDWSTITNAKSAIEAARGSRTFLSGQDADLHLAGSPGFVNNGPRGFLINAVNWAASGTGLGIVALADGFVSVGSSWFSHADSFLRNELLGYLNYFQDEQVIIPGAYAAVPINEGLTTGGLSNWGTSAHMGFADNIPGYAVINDSGALPNFSITIVTEDFVGGGTGGGDEDGEVPAPAALGLIGLGLALMARRRR